MLVTMGRECTKAEKQGCLGDLYYSVFSCGEYCGGDVGELRGFQLTSTHKSGQLPSSVFQMHIVIICLFENVYKGFRDGSAVKG